MCNYMRFGGLAFDLPEQVREQPTMAYLNELVYERLPTAMAEFERLITAMKLQRHVCRVLDIYRRRCHRV